MRRLDKLGGLDRISSEILDLLVSYYFFRKQSDRLVAQNPGGLEALEMLVSIQTLTNDIILRLCKLDDDDNRNWSFREVLKKLRKQRVSTVIEKEVEKDLKRYRLLINNLKIHHRNVSITHLAKTPPQPFKPTFQMKDAILLAVKIHDTLHGEKVTYTIDKDWSGEEINLLKEI